MGVLMIKKMQLKEDQEFAAYVNDFVASRNKDKEAIISAIKRSINIIKTCKQKDLIEEHSALACWLDELYLVRYGEQTKEYIEYMEERIEYMEERIG